MTKSSVSDRFIQWARLLLPSPMSIAILLTVLTLLLALFLTKAPKNHLLVQNEKQEKLAYLELGKKTISEKIYQNNDSFLIEWKANRLVLSNSKGESLVDTALQFYPKKAASLHINLNEKQVIIQQTSSKEPYFLQLLGYWEGSFFSFLTFAMQMMLILVLGHVLALTKPVNWLILKLVRYCNSSPRAAYIVSLATLLVAFFNWGLALIFGAILARKVGEQASIKGWKLNYPLVGAAGYSGLMVWHGGLSGSAPLKVAEQGHEFVAKIGVIPFSETIFSGMNLTCSFLLLLLIPLAMYLLARLLEHKDCCPDLNISKPLDTKTKILAQGAEKLDQAKWLAWTVGIFILSVGLYKAFVRPIWIEGLSFDWQFRFINPNYIIFMLLGLAILLQNSFQSFNKAVEEAIGGAAGIMIQFPLYAGIMGIMLESGLVNVFSDGFLSISTTTSFPIFTFFSAGLVNMFVPSGGGQWLVQGPIIIEAAQSMQVPIPKSIMALCYGDQITNMLQPFWALPLLGITKLKAQEILPYTFFLLLLGSLIFCSVLFIF